MTNNNEFEQFKWKYIEELNNYNISYNIKYHQGSLIIEFLQLKIMQFIAKQEYWKRMILIWWSALRHLRNWIRKTYDLDYDSIWIDKEYFYKICWEIQEFLEKNWCYATCNINTEWKTENDVYNCTFLIWSWNNKYNVTPLIDWEINFRLKVDLKDSDWNYPTEWVVPSKSIENIAIQTAVISSLLSKKICWFLWREHRASVAKDLIDIVFLLRETHPDFNYLYRYEDISNKEELMRRMDLKYNRISDEEIEKSIDNLWNDLFDKDYVDVPYDALEIIKGQLSYY